MDKIDRQGIFSKEKEDAGKLAPEFHMCSCFNYPFSRIYPEQKYAKPGQQGKVIEGGKILRYEAKPE